MQSITDRLYKQVRNHVSRAPQHDLENGTAHGANPAHAFAAQQAHGAHALREIIIEAPRECPRPPAPRRTSQASAPQSPAAACPPHPSQVEEV